MDEAVDSIERRAALALLKILQQGTAQDWLTDDEYFEQLEKREEIAKGEIQSGGNAQHVFTLIGRHRKTKQFGIMPCLMADWPPEGMSKYEAMQGLGIMFAEKMPDFMLVAVAHVSEGWLAQYPTDIGMKAPYLPEGVPTPSQRKDRVEVLMVTLTSIDQRMSYSHTEILRDDDGKFAGWGREWAHLYDRDEPINDPKQQADYLALNIFMGYFAAGVPVQGGKHASKS